MNAVWRNFFVYMLIQIPLVFTPGKSILSLEVINWIKILGRPEFKDKSPNEWGINQLKELHSDIEESTFFQSMNKHEKRKVLEELTYEIDRQEKTLVKPNKTVQKDSLDPETKRLMIQNFPSLAIKPINEWKIQEFEEFKKDLAGRKPFPNVSLTQKRSLLTDVESEIARRKLISRPQESIYEEIPAFGATTKSALTEPTIYYIKHFIGGYDLDPDLWTLENLKEIEFILKTGSLIPNLSDEEQKEMLSEVNEEISRKKRVAPKNIYEMKVTQPQLPSRTMPNEPIPRLGARPRVMNYEVHPVSSVFQPLMPTRTRPDEQILGLDLPFQVGLLQSYRILHMPSLMELMLTILNERIHGLGARPREDINVTHATSINAPIRAPTFAPTPTPVIPAYPPPYTNYEMMNILKEIRRNEPKTVDEWIKVDKDFKIFNFDNKFTSEQVELFKEWQHKGLTAAESKERQLKEIHAIINPEANILTELGVWKANTIIFLLNQLGQNIPGNNSQQWKKLHDIIANNSVVKSWSGVNRELLNQYVKNGLKRYEKEERKKETQFPVFRAASEMERKQWDMRIKKILERIGVHELPSNLVHWQKAVDATYWAVDFEVINKDSANNIRDAAEAFLLDLQKHEQEGAYGGTEYNVQNRVTQFSDLRISEIFEKLNLDPKNEHQDWFYLFNLASIPGSDGQLRLIDKIYLRDYAISKIDEMAKNEQIQTEQQQREQQQREQQQREQQQREQQQKEKKQKELELANQGMERLSLKKPYILPESIPQESLELSMPSLSLHPTQKYLFTASGASSKPVKRKVNIRHKPIKESVPSQVSNPPRKRHAAEVVEKAKGQEVVEQPLVEEVGEKFPPEPGLAHLT